jgi:hypothetical protein
MVAPRQRITPLHVAVRHPEAPLPTAAKNKFAAPFPPDSPTAPAEAMQPAALFEHAPATVCPDSFMATFLASWPEMLITDDSSHWIYDTLCKGFVEADEVYLTLHARQCTLQQDTDSTLRAHKATTRRELDNTWTTTLGQLDNNNQILRTTAAQILASVASTAHLAKDLLSQKTFLEKKNTRVQRQSGILNTITRNNNQCDACMKATEGSLADGDTRLTGLCTTTKATTSSLCTDINNTRACLIPDLRRNIKHEFSKALARVPFSAANGPIPPKGQVLAPRLRGPSGRVSLLVANLTCLRHWLPPLFSPRERALLRQMRQLFWQRLPPPIQSKGRGISPVN